MREDKARRRRTHFVFLSHASTRNIEETDDAKEEVLCSLQILLWELHGGRRTRTHRRDLKGLYRALRRLERDQQAGFKSARAPPYRLCEIKRGEMFSCGVELHSSFAKARGGLGGGRWRLYWRRFTRSSSIVSWR